MPLSEEDIAQVKEAIGIDKLAESLADTVQKKINGALTDHTKRQASSLEKLLEPVVARIAGIEEKTNAAPPAPGPNGEPPKPPSVQDTPEFKGMQKKLADLEKKAIEAEQREQAEKARAQAARLRQQLSEAVASKLKIEGIRTKHAVNALIDSVKWSEDGEALVFRDSDGSETDLESGLANWAKTEDAKIYLPPTNARGAGTRPNSGGAPLPAGSKEQAVNNLFGELDKVL